MQGKIVTREELVRLREELRSAGKRVGFTSGVFDIVHPGHVEYLEQARAQVDVLLVGLNSDSSVKANKGETRPIVPQRARAEVVAGMQAVDYVFIFSERNNNLNIELIKPDVYLKAGDYSPNQLTSKQIVESYGGEVKLVPFRAGLSTTEIIEKIALMAQSEEGQQIVYERRPAIFVDRDGTINEHVEYLSDPKLFREIPGGLAALARLRGLGYRIIVVTNQPGIGLGYFSREDLFAVNREMLKQASQAGCAIDKIYFCSHSKADNCECRKPSPYFLKRAEQELNIDLSKSFMIGDMSPDIQFGKNGGCRTVLVKTGRGGEDGICQVAPDYEAPNLAEAAAWIEKQGAVVTVPYGGAVKKEPNLGDNSLTVSDRLATTIGYDFNTLLGSILGCAALIGQKTSGRDGVSSVDDVLEILRKATNRGLALSKKLLSSARNNEFTRARKSLLSCVNAVVELVSSTRRGECQIEVLCPQDVEVKIADFTVVQMLLELCENSLDAMQALPERFILFHIDRVQLADDANLLGLAPGIYGRVSIVDHGEGINDDPRMVAVQPSFSTNTRELQGGLGRSMLMAQNVMKRHGGTLVLASRREAGTNIALYFPVVAE